MLVGAILPDKISMFEQPLGALQILSCISGKLLM